MSDIIERLRRYNGPWLVPAESANEIEKLRGEVATAIRTVEMVRKQREGLRAERDEARAKRDAVQAEMLDGRSEFLRMKAERDAAIEQQTAISDALDYLHGGTPAMATQLASLKAERDAALETLRFVERWACHHGAKPHVTAEQALSMIQHYPPIKAITGTYVDGVVPDTPDPWAERDAAVARYRHVIEILRRDGYWASLMDDAEIDAQVDAARGEK